MPSPLPPTQPHSLEAEATVLGALLLDPDAIFKVRSLLQSEDFFDPTYGRIYSACADLCDSQTPIDFTIVGEALKGRCKDPIDWWFSIPGGPCPPMCQPPVT